jgi:hypothetical protein
MRIKTTRGIRNVRYRSLHQQTHDSEAITFNPAAESAPQSTDNIPHISQYAPIRIRDPTAHPLLRSPYFARNLNYPLPPRPKSVVSNNCAGSNLDSLGPHPDPDLPSDLVPDDGQLHPAPPAMSSIDNIVTQIDSLLRRSELHRPPINTQSSPPSTQLRHPDSTRGQELVSCATPRTDTSFHACTLTV